MDLGDFRASSNTEVLLHRLLHQAQSRNLINAQDPVVVDISTIVGTDETDLEFFTKDPFGIQFIWDSLTGTLDGVINLYSSNDNVNFELLDNFTPIAVTTANDSASVFKSFYSFKYLRIEFVKNSITGGDFTYLISK